MSDTFDYDDFDQFDGLQGNDLVSALRKQLKAAAKETKALKESSAEKERTIADLTGKVNGQTLESVLKEKGAKPALAKFMKDVDPTPEAVEAWLSENGELFGYNPKAGESQEGQPSGENQGMTPEMAAALATMQKVQQQEANAAPGQLGSANSAEDFLKRVGQNATSFDDVEKALRTAGFFNLPT